ncbi:uncharacterized protein TRAVEDRAFT_126463 [Trametes versicolor FP-101664 SS1]|uniref:uncharacterized protein n=1 Tax=Trametes versicolor (strain FP-101664) TaxID=717944 RepID=UPI0004621ED2|nr:uncharacterized protein TRAVEDRAFT_126463 [Trametes versicolor FP-101664 SS1]EIW57206.1 hypothetical protein TRAVEDRAFT_126463 [Trametes versicolor FP-101664 SS1]
MITSVSRNAFKRVIARPSTSALGATPRFYSSTMHDNDPDVLEQEKKRNLSKEQHKTSTPHPDHAPGWNENLASASEAAIKADQAGVTPGDLQEKTVKYVKERHHATDSATTTEPGVSTSRMAHTSSGEASNKRDEIDGPLKTAHGTKST